MKWLALISALILAGCGFSPVYKSSNGTADRASVESLLSQVDIAIIKDREGQFLRNALIDRFYQDGYPTSPKYRLVVDDVQETITDFDITVDSEATRRQLELRTSYKLYAFDGKSPLMTRSIIAVTSNNVLESEFSTIVTEQSARESALNDLARQIQRQLAVYFQNNR